MKKVEVEEGEEGRNPGRKTSEWQHAATKGGGGDWASGGEGGDNGEGSESEALGEGAAVSGGSEGHTAARVAARVAAAA